MKRQIKFSLLVVTLLAMISVTSCLKDKEHTWDFSGNKPMVEIPEPANPSSGLMTRTIEMSDAVSISIPINLASPNVLSTDVVVTLSLDAASLAAKDLALWHAAYVADTSLGWVGLIHHEGHGNLLGADTLEILDPSLYTVASWEVTIPAGQRLVSFPIVINSNGIDLATKWIIPIKISAVTAGVTIASNFGNVLIMPVVKNKYDGLYLLKGVHNRVPFIFPYETKMQMRTADAQSVLFYWPDVSSNGHPIGVAANNGMSWYGSGISPVIRFDLVTNAVLDVYNIGSATPITMYTGAGANSNNFNPITRTILVTWNYNHNALRVFNDTLTYIGPRP